MNKSIIEDAQHWRECAEEMCAVAETLSDAEAQRMILGIAEGYERLAQRAQYRADAKTSR
jgi:hypothetical protein